MDELSTHDRQERVDLRTAFFSSPSVFIEIRIGNYVAGREKEKRVSIHYCTIIMRPVVLEQIV